jgi:hypothetical protein
MGLPRITGPQELYEFITPANNPLAADVQEGDGKKLWLKGIFIQGDVENANGRVYPRDEIANAVNSINKRIKETGPVPGELDHPENLQINLKNVSHLIHEMWVEGSDGLGKLLVADNVNGEIVRSLITGGMNMGVSSRGSGSVDSRGRVSEFDIVTVDIVATPSAPNAYPKPVFEQLLNNRFGRELKYLAEIRNDLTAQKHFKKVLNSYLLSIRDEILIKRK